ncbi:DUF2188 domain-containing protein [Plantactinospora siamensis]|uniref:DUF2188 domain-containing protein n=1 Tax=Plantactinospora siamensis TaxID=555372 RepID=A0ABV6P829_9ACTN
MAQDRDQYHVVPDSQNDQWKVEKDSKTVDSYDTKHEALQGGRETAHKHEPSQVIVHKGDGKIEEERTYRDDPYPPAG